MSSDLPGTVEDLIKEYGIEEVLRRFLQAYGVYQMSKEKDCENCEGKGVTDCPECGQEVECSECNGSGVKDDE